MTRPFCFVLMAFGKKPDAAGRIVDFDSDCQNVIVPAINDADLQPIRADEELTIAMGKGEGRKAREASDGLGSIDDRYRLRSEYKDAAIVNWT